jgi:hypothetical protein
LNIRPCCAEKNLGFIGDLAGNPAGGRQLGDTFGNVSHQAASACAGALRLAALAAAIFSFSVHLLAKKFQQKNFGDPAIFPRKRRGP